MQGFKEKEEGFTRRHEGHEDALLRRRLIV